MLFIGSSQDVVQKTRDDINDFSTTGLRTLLICCKEISEGEYAEIDERYHAADTFVGSEKEKEAKMAEVAKLFEHSFDLLGCTAIEDRLQKMVPETIHNLLRVCPLFLFLFFFSTKQFNNYVLNNEE